VIKRQITGAVYVIDGGIAAGRPRLPGEPSENLCAPRKSLRIAIQIAQQKNRDLLARV
jgi:hypothetical protein